MLTLRKTGKFSWKFSYVLILLVVLAISYSTLITHLTKEKIRTDSFIIYTSGWLLKNGNNPYIRTKDTPAINPSEHRKTIPNLSPPFATMVVSIASNWLKETQLELAVRLLNIITNLLAIFLLVNYFFQQNKLFIFLAITLLDFAFMGTIYSFSFGEISLFLNLLLILSMLFYHKNKDVYAGSVLGFAANIKLFFGIFVFLYLAQKRPKALTGFIITASTLAITPIIIYGFSLYLGYFKTLSEIDWYPVNLNASYLGMLCRIFGDANARFHSIFNLPTMTYTLYYSICTYYIYLIFNITKKLKNNAAKSYAFVITSMLLLSPLGWYYYFPLLLLGFIDYFKSIQQRKNYLIYLFAFLVILLVLNMPYGMQRTDTTSLLFQLTIGSYLFVCLLGFHIAQLCLLKSTEQTPTQSQKPTLLSNNLFILVFSAIFLISTSVGLFRFTKTKPNNTIHTNSNQQTNLLLNLN